MAFGAASCQTCSCSELSCAPCETPSECSNCASCCCGSEHKSWRLARIKTGLRLEYFSSAWMGVEVAGSIGVGLMAGSLALLAFGSDSIVELVSAFVVMGHLRRNSSGSEILGGGTAKFTRILLFSLIPIIGLGAGYAYLSGVKPEGSPLAIAVAAGAVIVMPYLWLEKRKIGKENQLSASVNRFGSIGHLLSHFAGSSRRASSGVLPKTLVGRLPSYWDNTGLRGERSSRIIPA